MFPKNAWYVACMPHEIDDKPLGRVSRIFEIVPTAKP